MRGWLQGVMLSTSLFGGSWIGAVSYWRATNRMPSALDLLVWLALLPLALLLAVWAGRRVMNARARDDTNAAPAPGQAVASVPAAAPAVPALAILAAAIRTPHGATPDELAQAIGAGRARADLDPALVDQDGFPVFSARVDSADGDAMAAELEGWRAQAGLDDPRFTPEQWRALALGTQVCTELLAQASAGARQVAQGALRGLRIHAVLGTDWDAAQRAQASAWMAALAIRDGWPAATVSASSPPMAAPGMLARLASQADQDGEPVFAIVLAFGSQVGEASVERLAARGALFGAATPQGLIPGEAAAGLLVAAPDGAAPTLQLAVAVEGADEGGAARNAGAARLRRLADALVPGADGMDAVTALFADTGHRSARQLELMKFAADALPQLDAGQDVKAVGGACGQCGDGAFLAALALARQHALDGAGAALCIANEDPPQHTAALVRPAAALS